MNRKFQVVVGMLLAGLLILTQANTLYAATSETPWQGEYFNNEWWAGQPALKREDAKIDFSWGNSNPPNIQSDSFSAKWLKTITLLEATTYRFSLFSAEGESRIVVNGEQFMGSRYRTELSNEVELVKGRNVIYVEYQSGNLGAYMRVKYEAVGPSQPMNTNNGTGAPCPLIGGWPTGCSPSSVSDLPCPSSGVWPKGCIPNANMKHVEQPCPPSGVWPTGCIPNLANGSEMSCPSSGIWPKGCIPS